MITVFSFTHQRTPEELFQQLHAVASMWKFTPQLFPVHTKIRGMLVLQTIDRIEFYFDSVAFPADFILDLSNSVENAFCNAQAKLKDSAVVLSNEKAKLHGLRVAAGLESVAVGEPEILVQLQTAWIESNKLGLSSRQLNSCIQRFIESGERVRREVALENTLSISRVAVEEIQRRCASGNQKNILIFGTGPYTESLSKRLAKQGDYTLFFVNSCLGKSRKFAASYSGIPTPIHEFFTSLNQAHVLVITQPLPENFLLESSLLVIDLSLPDSNFHHFISGPNVFYSSWNDLSQIILNNREIHEEEIEHAENILTEELNKMELEDSHDSSKSLMETLRAEMEQVRLRHVELHSKRFAVEEYDQLHKFSRSLTSALLHKLTNQLQELSKESAPRDFLSQMVDSLDEFERQDESRKD